MIDFKRTLHFQAPKRRVFDCLTNDIPSWWTEMFEGTSNEVGKTFTVKFGPDVFKTMFVEELVENEKVVWRVIDSVIGISGLKNKSEWNDTLIVWNISVEKNETTLVLTHIGLTPEIECYAICETGWQSFTDSLSALINTGTGSPFRSAGQVEQL